MRRSRWHDVLSAVRAAYEYDPCVQAIDLEAMAARVSPYAETRPPTVRSTGRPGSPLRVEPLAAVAHARMVRLLLELPERMRHVVLARACGRPSVPSLAKHYGVHASTAYDWVELGCGRLQARMVEVGLWDPT